MFVTSLDLPLNELVKVISDQCCKEIDNKLTWEPRSIFGMGEVTLCNRIVAPKFHDVLDAQTLVVRAVSTSGLISLEVYKKFVNELVYLR